MASSTKEPSMQRSIFNSVCVFAAGLILAHVPARAAEHPAFRVDISGEGQPIILIPGLASSGAAWDGTVARFCGQHQCHVLTLAGFAGMAPIDGQLLPAVEQQLSDYIADLHLDHPTVIGHSLGGYLGIKLAADHPQQVGRLIIVDALPAYAAIQKDDVTQQQSLEMANQLRDKMNSADSAAYAAAMQRGLSSKISKQADVERELEIALRSDRATCANAMFEMTATDLRPELARITAPTLVLGTWIAYRQYVPKTVSEALYQRQYRNLAGVTIAMSDSARHFIMYDDPDWLYARIEQFLK